MFRAGISLKMAAVVLAVMAAGCKNELHLNAPYKEIPSVYAVLDPTDSIHRIRINKVFLGEGDANAMAKVADSVNYPAGELDVQLIPVEYGFEKTPIVFKDTVIVKTAEGAFNTNQRIWVSNAKLTANPSTYYRLVIKNNKTGNVFTSSAEPVQAVKPSFVRPLTATPQYPYPAGTKPEEYIDYSQQAATIRFNPTNAKLYQILIRTHFYDSTHMSPVKRYDYVDYNFSTQEERNKQVQGSTAWLNTNFGPADYFGAVELALSRKNLPTNIFGRKVYMIEYFVYSTTQEYIDFLQYSSPSFALTQNVAIYSNFDNKAAIGIFTFRNTFSVRKQPSTIMQNEFARNPNTCGYLFLDSKGIRGNCPD